MCSTSYNQNMKQLLDFIEIMCDKAKNTKYEKTCRSILQKFDQLDHQRLSTIIKIFQEKINWNKVDSEDDQVSEKTMEIRERSENDDGYEIVARIEISDSDEENKENRDKDSGRNDSATADENPKRNSDDKELIIRRKTSWFNSAKKRTNIIYSNESSSSADDERKNKGKKRCRVRRVSSSDGDVSSSRTSLPQTVNSRSSRSSRSPIKIKRTRNSQNFSVTNGRRKRRATQTKCYNENSESIEESDDDAAFYKTIKSINKRRKARSLNCGSTDSNDEPLFRMRTVADYICYVMLENNLNLQNIAETVRVEEKDGKFTIKPLTHSIDKQIVDCEPIDDSDDDIEQYIDKPIPITRSYSVRTSASDKTNSSYVSMDIDDSVADRSPRPKLEKKSNVAGEKNRVSSDDDDEFKDCSEEFIEGASVNSNRVEEQGDSKSKPKQEQTNSAIQNFTQTINGETSKNIDEDSDSEKSLIIVDYPPEIISIDDSSSDSDSESQTERRTTPVRVKIEPSKSSPIPKVIENAERKVQNIAFVKCRLGLLFKCYADSCKYQTSDESAMKYHLESRHPFDIFKWCGFCNLCGKSYSNYAPLLKEFEHLKEHHIDNPNQCNEKERGQKSRSSSKDSKKSNCSKKSNKPKRNSNFNSTACRELNFPTSNSDDQCSNVESVPNLVNGISKEKNTSENETESQTTKDESETFGKLKQVEKLIEMLGSDSSEIEPIDKENIIPEQRRNESDKDDTQSLENSHSSESAPPVVVTIPKSVRDHLEALSSAVPSTNSSAQNEKSVNTLGDENIFRELQQIEETSEKALFKVRNLPGDKLSGTSQEDSTPNLFQNNNSSNANDYTESTNLNEQNGSQPSELVKIPQNRATIIPISSVQKALSLQTSTKPINIVLMQKTNKLRPWLSNLSDIKVLTITRTMLQSDCLIDLYKCMDMNCQFHTQNSEIFVAHLKLHKTNDPLAESMCSYCPFKTSDDKALVDHITVLHGKSKYLCKHCFYRTTCSYNINRHIRQFHDKLDHSIGGIIHLPNVNDLNEEEELKIIKTSYSKFISPVTCSACKAKFFNTTAFENHRKELHPSGFIYKCNVCQQVANEINLHTHLSQCHRIKKYHCVYCFYGSDLLDHIADHLMNTHNNKLPFYCERSSSSQTAVDPASIESISLRIFKVNRLENW